MAKVETYIEVSIKMTVEEARALKIDLAEVMHPFASTVAVIEGLNAELQKVPVTE